MTTPTPPPRRKLQALIALLAAAALVGAGALWLSSDPPPPAVPPQALPKITQALLLYYQQQQAFTGFQPDTEPLNKTKPGTSPQTALNPPKNTVAFQITSISERKTRHRLVLTIRPTFNGGPPPDGIPERTVTLFQSAPDIWEVQPILPSGAPPLSQEPHQAPQ